MPLRAADPKAQLRDFLRNQSPAIPIAIQAVKPTLQWEELRFMAKLPIDQQDLQRLDKTGEILCCALTTQGGGTNRDLQQSPLTMFENGRDGYYEAHLRITIARTTDATTLPPFAVDSMTATI